MVCVSSGGEKHYDQVLQAKLSGEIKAYWPFAISGNR